MRREGLEVIDPSGRNSHGSPEENRGSLEEFLISPTATPQVLGPTAVVRELQDGEVGPAKGSRSEKDA